MNNCPIHGTPMRDGTYGPYCATPTRKSPDGTKVLEWCQAGKNNQTVQSGQEVKPTRDEMLGKAVANMNNKLDILTDLVKELLATRVQN